jgi:phospholipase/carboxylesterase
MREYVHRFIPSPTGLSNGLLLLHGTGGNESSLLELGAALDPEAALLAPRGKSLEEGAPRFFRRFSEGVFDEDDVRRRADELGDWIGRAKAEYGLTSLIAAGFSNGANMATSLMLLRPDAVDHVVAFRGQIVLQLTVLPDLRSRRVLLLQGERDRYASREFSAPLASQFAQSGAIVEQHWVPSGHTVTRGDLQIAQHWLRATCSLSSDSPMDRQAEASA